MTRLHPDYSNAELSELSERQLAKIIGLSRSTIWRCKKLAEIPEAIFEEMLSEGLTGNQMIAIWRQQNGRPLAPSGGQRCPNCGHRWGGSRAGQGGSV